MNEPRTTPAAATTGLPLKIDHVTLLVASLETSMPYYDALLPVIGFSKKRDHVWTDGRGFSFSSCRRTMACRPISGTASA